MDGFMRFRNGIPGGKRIAERKTKNYKKSAIEYQKDKWCNKDYEELINKVIGYLKVNLQNVLLMIDRFLKVMNTYTLANRIKNCSLDLVGPSLMSLLSIGLAANAYT